MKQTFTQEEVFKIVREVHEADFRVPMAEYMNNNMFTHEQALDFATKEYMETSNLTKEQ